MSHTGKMVHNVDIAILGSGFAGSILALLLNKIGLSCVVIDKAAHPRFAIGESSTPIGNMILRDLAKTYNLPELAPLATFGTWRDAHPQLLNGRKRGFSYFQHTQDNAFKTDDRHSNELLVTASTDNYHCDTHWLRADVDHYLVQRVREANIPVLENTRIHEMDNVQESSGTGTKEQKWILSGRQAEQNIKIDASFIVDGTGSAGLVARHLNLSNENHQLHTRSHAVFSHFDGLPRWHDLSEQLGTRTSDHPYFCDDAAVHQCIQRGWMWMLRFVNDRVSAGFALHCDHYRMNYSVSPEKYWEVLLAQYPSLEQLFEKATLAETPGKLYRTGRLQRMWGQAAGENWALLPHTAGFVDPFHSTGIAHSLSGVERLAHILKSHWGSAELEKTLQGYSNKVIRELKLIDLLVAGCYPCFGQFDLLTTYTMLYFAAAITYEERRTAASKSGAFFPHDFLCADEKPLVESIKSAFYALQKITASSPTATQISQFQKDVKESIAPYNTAGLFSPKINNMYEYTAAIL